MASRTGVAQRVRKHRLALRAAGLRPIQIWVPDSRRAGFADEFRRQCLVLRRGKCEAEPSEVAGKRRRHRGVEVKWGEVVKIVLPRAYVKARPALVIQSDFFDALTSVTILLIRSDLRTAPLLRIPVDSTDGSGLRKKSQIMIDKTQTVPRDKVGTIIGRLPSHALIEVDRALATFLGIG